MRSSTPSAKERIPHIIEKHLQSTQEVLVQFSNSFAGGAKHKTNLGSAREALTSNFLSRNLPSAIEYAPGELFDSAGDQSGQIDLILIPNSSPKVHLFGAITLASVDTVLGVVEVKSNMTSGIKGELAAALRHCANVKRLTRSNGTGIRFMDHSMEFLSCPYILFAYDGPKQSTAVKLLESMAAEIKTINPKIPPLGSMPDLIVVLSRNYVLAKNSSWVNAGATPTSAFHEGDSKFSALFHMYCFVTSLVDHWTTNPEDFRLPQADYFKTKANLDALFGDNED